MHQLHRSLPATLRHLSVVATGRASQTGASTAALPRTVVSALSTRSFSSKVKKEKLHPFFEKLNNPDTVSKREITADPADFVQNATRDDLKDPDFAEFMAANFPEHFDPEYDPEATDEFASLPQELFLNEPNPSKPKKKMPPEEREKLDNAPFNMRPLKAYLRDPETERKKYAAAAMREVEAHLRCIPGVVLMDTRDPTATAVHQKYQPQWDPKRLLIKTPWPQLQREFVKYLDRVENSRVYNLSIYEHQPPPPPKWYKEEEMKEWEANLPTDPPIFTRQVVPKSVNWDPRTDYDVYCMNFAFYYPGKTVIELPVKFVNKDLSPALRGDSCFMLPIARKVPVLIEDGVFIPDYLNADCTDMQVGDVLRRDRLLLPDGVKLHKSVMNRAYVNYVVGVVYGSRRYMMDAKEAAAAGEAKK